MERLGGCYIRIGLIICLLFTGAGNSSVVWPQGSFEPGRITLSPAFQPAQLSAIRVDKNDPMRFEFFVDDPQATSDVNQINSHDIYAELVKDFFTVLTVPENDLWVNLSPYENDRLIEPRFGLTGMGRDLLQQDFVLKQLTASLLYPEDGVGKQFWDEIYRQAYVKFGTTDVPLDTFNKVWIIPDHAEIYQEGTTALVLSGHLSVMLESDYLASDKAAAATRESLVPSRLADADPLQTMIPRQVMREVVIPVLEKEVNEGKNFARLRQMYQAMILAVWYKQVVRDALLNKAFVDRGKTSGMVQPDPGENLRIYAAYVNAYRRGAFNLIREEVDEFSGEILPRKYFAGGFTEKDFSQKVAIFKEGDLDAAQRGIRDRKASTPKQRVKVQLQSGGRQDDRFGSEVKEIVYKLQKNSEEIINRRLEEGAEYSDADRKQLQYFRDDSRKCAMQAIRLVLQEEEQSEAIITKLGQKMVGAEESTLQSMLLGGVYTMDVLRQIRVVALLSRTNKEIPYGEVFDLMGLRKASQSALARIVASFKNVKGFEALDDALFGVLKLSESELQRNGADFTGLLAQLRKDDPDFNFEYDSKQAKGQGINQLRAKLQGWLPSALKIVKRLVGSDRPVSIRVKSDNSVIDKLRRKDPFYMSDFIGARVIFENLSELEEQQVRFRQGELKDVIETLGEWLIASHREEERLKKERKRHKRGTVDYARLSDEIKALSRNRDNLAHQRKVILVEYDNKFLSVRDKSYYRALQYLFTLGIGKHTFELQFKTILSSISQDIEHDFYKAERREETKNSVGEKEFSPLAEAIRRYNWLVNIVEMLNYLYERKDIRSEWITNELERFVPKDGSLGVEGKDNSVRDKAQVVPGGIDARSVLSRLNVRGRSDILYDSLATDPDWVDSELFTPEILSVELVDGLPWHRRALPRS